MSKLKELAAANITAKDQDKALAQLDEAIEKNQNDFQNAIFGAKSEVREAEKLVARLAADPNADPIAIIDADDDLAVAKKTYDQLVAKQAARF